MGTCGQTTLSSVTLFWSVLVCFGLFWSVLVIMEAFRPYVPLSFLQSELAYLDEEELRNHLIESGAVICSKGRQIDLHDANNQICDLDMDTKASHVSRP